MIKKLREKLERRVGLERLSFWNIFVLQTILFFAIYGIMLVPRFSTDSYSTYFFVNGDLGGFLTSGRTGTFLLYKVLLALGINSVTLSPAFTAVFCLTVAWSSAVVLSSLRPYFPNPSWMTLLLLGTAVTLSYGNIYFAELFFFSDVALVYAFTILFMTLALISFFNQNRVMGTGLSLLCMCISLSFYQSSLGLFMILCSTLVLLRHDLLWPQSGKYNAGPLLRELLCLLVVGGGASIVNVLGMKLLGAAGFYSHRAPSLDLADILTSVQQMLGQLKYYYPWGYPKYLTGILKVVFILAGPVLLFLMSDSFDKNSWERYPLLSVIITMLVLVADLLLVFAPHFLSKSVWLTPRSIFSLFALFSFMAILTAYNDARKGKNPSMAALAVVLLLAGANIIGIQRIALDQIKVNQLDKGQAEEIIQCIQEYEQESGQTVDMVSWRADSDWTRAYPEIKYTFMDMNVRASARYWSLPDCISYYAGHRLRSESMPDEIWIKYFQGQDWESFQPEEQIRFEAGTMYLMVY